MNNLLNARNTLIEAIALIDKALAEGHLSNIERDILLSKLSNSYDDILLGANLESTKTSVANGLNEYQALQKDGKSKVDNGDDKKEREQINQSKEVKEGKNKLTNKMPEPEPTISSTTGNDDEISSSEILADKYKGKRRFRDEVIAEHTQTINMQTRLQNKPISDLSKAIGINDKFLFIKELFNGDAERYSQTIKALNSFTDLNDAIIYIQENFDWDPNDETVVAFIDLVRRKFS